MSAAYPPQSSSRQPAPPHCPSCGATFRGPWCAQCGEHQLTPELRSLRHHFATLFEAVTSLESRFWRTLRALLLQPGAVDLAWHRGARAAWVQPISLFLLINVVFVLLSPINDFYVSFLEQRTYQPYSPWLQAWIEQLAIEYGPGLEAFARRYDQAVHLLARSLIIVQTPFFALWTALMLVGRGRYASDHLVYSLNTHAWFMIWLLLLQIPGWLIDSLLGLFDLELSGGAYFALLPWGLLLYLLLSVRRAYELGWWSALWRTPLLFIGLFASHMLYRFCQLLITMAVVVHEAPTG